MGDRVTVRAATPDDARAMQAIYAPYVDETAISFELTPPTVAEFEARMRATTTTLPWLAAENDGAVVGYAYASRHHERAAYRWAVETSVYVDGACRSRGVGTALYEALIRELRSLGYVSAYTGIALPNDASVALHERFGFVSTGRLPAAGYKLGTWHDVNWWYLALAEPPVLPSEPTHWAP